MNITVVGCGYVGVTTGVCLASVGHHVRCVDTLPERVAMLTEGRLAFHEPGMQDALQAGSDPHAATHPEVFRVRSADMILKRDVPFDGAVRAQLLAPV